jgi:hypothetical protein
MQRQVLFRDYQEQVTDDHLNVQKFAADAIDALVTDAVTATRRYAGFLVAKTAQAEVRVAAGRFYDLGGAVFGLSSQTTQSIIPYLAAGSRRIIAVSAYGAVVDTNVQERDFITNVDTGETEPQAVAMERARQAQLVFTSGAESGDPQPPAVPSTHAVIAHILVDTTQVIAVTMLTQNAVASTEAVAERTRQLEIFRGQVEPRVNSLASDLVSLSNTVSQGAGKDKMVQLFRDVARVKAALEIPDTASDYGADRFLDTSKSDVANAQALGFDALVQEGIRFPAANQSINEIDVFSANDPNAALQNGLLLPAFDHVLKMEIGPFHSDIGIAQYGFQTFDIEEMQMSRQRLRYGSIFTVCTNAQWWLSGQYDPTTQTFRKDGETFEVLDPQLAQMNHVFPRLRQIFVDTYTEPYWQHTKTEHSISGAQHGNGILIANDTWITRLGFFLTAKAAPEAVHVTVCEITNGFPDLSKTILQQTVAHGALVEGGWTVFNVPPTFAKAGKRIAIMATSNANHKFGMAHGQSYLDGTYYATTDGSYYLGDLTKDMMLQVWGARFRAPQVAIELEALNLDGGIRAIDLLYAGVTPQSTQLIFEVMPGGAGDWRSLTAEDLAAFAATPPLARFRARFIGSRDMMPALMLQGSQVKLLRPKTAFKHISEPITLAAPSDEIVIKLTLEDFDDTPHDCAARLRVGAAWETPDLTQTVLLDAADKRYERTLTYNLGAPTSTFTLEITGSTTGAGNTFHVAERVHYAL